MGQKVHPIGFRVGVTTGWDSKWYAARDWLHLSDASRFAPERFKWRVPSVDDAAWRALWRPYWLAKRRVPGWLPLRASETALYAI